MFKHLMVPITGSPGDMPALNIAIDIATSHGAHLTVLEMVSLPIPPAAPWGLTPDIGMSELYSRLRSQGEINVARLEARLAQERIPVRVKLVESLADPSLLAAHHAHSADLTVVAGSVGDTAEATLTHAYFGSLLLESGRPVLVVPPRCTAVMPPRRVLVAWRPTREAARALHDAMPFLVGAEAVVLMSVDAIEEGDASDGQAVEDIEVHLAHHGVKSKVVIRKSGAHAVSAMLLDQAREMHADLLVAGGYGHSRLREWAMGGVTRELLIGASRPVLYSH